jgi:hypothetical protein
VLKFDRTFDQRVHGEPSPSRKALALTYLDNSTVSLFSPFQNIRHRQSPFQTTTTTTTRTKKIQAMAQERSGIAYGLNRGHVSFFLETPRLSPSLFGFFPPASAFLSLCLDYHQSPTLVF